MDTRSLVHIPPRQRGESGGKHHERIAVSRMTASRFLLIAALLLASVPVPAATAGERLEAAVAALGERERSHNLVVAVDGERVAPRNFRGPGLREPANTKSLAKTFIAALVGAAIEQGAVAGVDQPVVELLGDRVPAGAPEGIERVTVGHLLSMQAGLERTSGANYGAWVSSEDWVADALARPFVDEPGGRMLYSTGNTHILSGALTAATGRSTLALAREWLGEPLNITIPAWQTDPQGVYFGGNNMSLSPLALLQLGELYRLDGVIDGRRVLPGDWVEQSWTPRGQSRYHDGYYGYGWFITDLAGEAVYFGWGYGGQFLYVVPDLALTVVLTSDPTPPAARSAHLRRVHAILDDSLLPAIRDR